MATVKEINHDSSTTLSDFYSTITDLDGALSVTIGAALGGSTNGLNMDFDAGTNSPVLEEPFTAISGNEMRFRVRVNIDNVTPFTAFQSIMNLYLENSLGGTIFRVPLNVDGSSVPYIYLKVSVDSGSGTMAFPTPVPSGDFCYAIRAIRETADGNADGIVNFYVNNSLIEKRTNLENFNVWASGGGMQNIRLTFHGGTSHGGDLYYDEFIIDDNNMADLGCGGFSGYDLVVGGGLP